MNLAQLKKRLAELKAEGAEIVKAAESAGGEFTEEQDTRFGAIEAEIEGLRADIDKAEKLAEREMQVLKGLTEGKSNKEIARDLDLTEPTIKLYLKTLYRKIDVNNRTQAALVAREAGLY
mgnify:CR=1 FL=1